jgi:pantoate--beta-alanine ligase
MLPQNLPTPAVSHTGARLCQSLRKPKGWFLPAEIQIVRTPRELTAAMEAWKRAGNRVAFVPTMGALHAGHLTLVEVGLCHADKVAASIFVNPKQFGPTEDLDRYPRDEAGDAAKLAAVGCTLLYAPTVETMYPPGFASYVRVAGLPDVLCGAARPGHFDGVATVVSKLLAAARADVAVFGEKDWQQLAIVRRMALDLDLGTEIIGGAIIRDSDGLALSSRNLYLTADERVRALALPQALAAARAALLAGGDVATVLAAARALMVAAGFARVDYVELVDGERLHSLTSVIPGARLMAAAVMGTTRLIDNLAV